MVSKMPSPKLMVSVGLSFGLKSLVPETQKTQPVGDENAGTRTIFKETFPKKNDVLKAPLHEDIFGIDNPKPYTYKG
jgi:hypothetical protein